MPTLITLPHARIEYFAEPRLLELTFTGFVAGNDLRNAYDQALDMASRHNARRWLNNFARMHAVRQADQDWLVNDLTPRLASRLQLWRSALVQSFDPMNQLFSGTIVERTTVIRRWETRFFDDRASAWQWLTEAEPDELADLV